MSLEQLKESESKLSKRVNDPQTPQGEVQDLQRRLSECRRQIKIEERKKFESENQISVYGSDDYCGASAGDYSFYYGYEVTECPVKNHKTDDDCYEKDCDKREWCFVVEKNGKEIVRWVESEFSYGQADCIERTLICGMAKFIKENIK